MLYLGSDLVRWGGLVGRDIKKSGEYGLNTFMNIKIVAL